MSPETFCAWAAGFIDGEGWIGTWSGAKHKLTYRQPRIVVVQTVREPLEMLKEEFGGSINVHGRYGKQKGEVNWSPAWRWTVTGRAAERTLFAVLPYLMVKKEKAVEALVASELSPRRYERQRAKSLVKD